MKLPTTALAASFFAVILASALALAQPVSTSTQSVEHLALHHPLIVRAVLDDIAIHAPRNSIHRYQTLTASVLETIKGEHAERLQFVDSGDFGSQRILKLIHDKQELLLFLQPWMTSRKFNRPAGGYAYTRFPFVVEQVAVLEPDKVQFAHSSIPPLTADLQVLSKPGDLVGAIKKYLNKERGPRPVGSVTIELPPPLRSGFFKAHLTFPADAIDPPAIEEAPVVDFAKFKRRFGIDPPVERKPPYTRNQTGYIGVYALELMAADCDAIVRGVIEDSCFVATSEDPTGPACGARLRVTEMLKGKAAEHVNFFVSDARDLEKLQRDRQEIVVFLRNQLLSGPAAALGHGTRDGLWDDSVIVLNRDSAEALFSNLTWHREPDEILKRLREVAPRQQNPPVFDVHPPSSIAAGSSLAGNKYSVIHLPVDQDLDANARKWATSDNKDLRWLAARAAIYFKSDDNAAMLRKLLKDEATWSRREMLQLIHPLDHEHDPEYLVRWEAWHVLDGWGQDVPQPSFRVGDAGQP